MGKKEAKKELKEKMVLYSNGVPMFPASKAMGMRDFISDIFGDHLGGLNYPCVWEAILENSSLKGGGYLVPENHAMYLFGDETGEAMYRAAMEVYDKYLCSDGIIRYWPNECDDMEYRQLVGKYDDEFCRRIDNAFESSGMVYCEEEGCWVNPETGERGYY